jgi:hypothetical protein
LYKTPIAALEQSSKVLGERELLLIVVLLRLSLDLCHSIHGLAVDDYFIIFTLASLIGAALLSIAYHNFAYRNFIKYVTASNPPVPLRRFRP